MMGVNTRNMQSCLQKCNKLNKSHPVGQVLNSIHDARTHVYKISYSYLFLLGENEIVLKIMLQPSPTASVFEIGEILHKNRPKTNRLHDTRLDNTARWLFLQYRISTSVLGGFVTSHTRFARDARSIHITFDTKSQKVILQYRRRPSTS